MDGHLVTGLVVLLMLKMIAVVIVETQDFASLRFPP